MIENDNPEINSDTSCVADEKRPLPHIGRAIEKELKSQNKSVVWLADAINCDRRNVYDIFTRINIDAQLLMRISLILQKDFFIYYSRLLRLSSVISTPAISTPAISTPASSHVGNSVHIGMFVREELHRQERTVTWLGRKIHCDRRNIYDIFARESIDMLLMMRISEALNIDLFQIYSSAMCLNINMINTPPPYVESERIYHTYVENVIILFSKDIRRIC